MAETATSRYVKLNKLHDVPMEGIHPGELNQPIHVPQLEVQRCIECRQALPESCRPPADEAWTTGICGCAEDLESCCAGCNDWSSYHQSIKVGYEDCFPIKKH